MEKLVAAFRGDTNFPAVKNFPLINAIKEWLSFEQIHQDWSFSKRNCDLTKIYKKKFTASLVEKILNGYVIVSIDEAAFGRKLNDKKKWIIKESGKPIASNYHKGERKLNIIGAITQHGVLGFLLNKGKTSMESFTCFLILLRRELNKPRYENKKVLLLWDGASIHTGEVPTMWLAFQKDYEV
jgi:hypothetical protein